MAPFCTILSVVNVIPPVVIAYRVYSRNSTWLVTSRLDTTRHVRRVERVETSVSNRAV